MNLSYDISNNLPIIPPLPAGEGWGEGGRSDANSSPKTQNPTLDSIPIRKSEIVNRKSRSFILAAIFIVGLLVSSCSDNAQPGNDAAAKMQVTSAAFANGQPIPDKYTCHGDDISPPLQWTGAPPQTKSFALVCEDPDAPGGTFTHWQIYNMPPSQTALSEDIAKNGTLDDGLRQGKNSFGNIGYNGPCPPSGNSHHYFFKVYALDTNLALDPGAEKNNLLNAMNGHILAHGELMGTYQIP